MALQFPPPRSSLASDPRPPRPDLPVPDDRITISHPSPDPSPSSFHSSPRDASARSTAACVLYFQDEPLARPLIALTSRVDPAGLVPIPSPAPPQPTCAVSAWPRSAKPGLGPPSHAGLLHAFGPRGLFPLQRPVLAHGERPSAQQFRPVLCFFLPDLRFSLFPRFCQICRIVPRVHAFNISQTLHRIKINYI